MIIKLKYINSAKAEHLKLNCLPFSLILKGRKKKSGGSPGVQGENETTCSRTVEVYLDIIGLLRKQNFSEPISKKLEPDSITSDQFSYVISVHPIIHEICRLTDLMS